MDNIHHEYKVTTPQTKIMDNIHHEYKVTTPQTKIMVTYIMNIKLLLHKQK